VFWFFSSASSETFLNSKKISSKPDIIINVPKPLYKLPGTVVRFLPKRVDFRNMFWISLNIKIYENISGWSRVVSGERRDRQTWRS
jgi:hypothetical protein